MDNTGFLNKVQEFLNKENIELDFSFQEEADLKTYYFPSLNKLPFWWCSKVYEYFDNIRNSETYSELYENYVNTISLFLLKRKENLYRDFELVPIEDILNFEFELISKLFFFITKKLNVIDIPNLNKETKFTRKLTLVKKKED